MGAARSYWDNWHDSYDEPGSSLSLRLATVQDFLRDALDHQPPGPITIISLCAGQGRDVVGVLHDHPRADDVTATLVELDPDNVAFARRSAADLPQVTVVEGDAARTLTVREAAPANVLLLCGIFGNITAADIERTVRNASRLCAPDARVLWTRGVGEPDLTIDIRQWFHESGWELLGHTVGPRGERAPFSVGYNHLVTDPLPFEDLQLFSFLPRTR